MKFSFMHNISVSLQRSTSIIVSVSVIFQFWIFFTEVTQAYLQSKEKLQRGIYVKLC